MYILGISVFYHDSAACLVKDGEIVAAAQEERLEALAVGKPVVATRVGAHPKIIEDGVTGFLVETGNPEQLADRIEFY